MIRYKHSINDFFATTKFNYKQKNPKDYGKSTVDKSQFRPQVNDVRNFEAMANGSTRTGLYDFADGKDTGLRLYHLRDPSADITEIDNVKQILSEEVEAEKKNFNKIMDNEVKKELSKAKEKSTVKIQGEVKNESTN